MLLDNSKSGIQMAARIVDTPCNEMHTDAFLDEVNFILNATEKLLYILYLTIYKLHI